MLKCSSKFNHHGTRDRMINKGLTSSGCPQCTEREEWNHVIKYKAIGRKKKQFIKTLHNKLMKDTINDETKLDNM